MEPFQRLVNQGMILSVTYRTAEGRIIPYRQIRFDEGKAFHAETGEALVGETEKMSKSRGNVIPVDVPIQRYGSDTTRLYEMFMGPLEATKPWSMQGIEGISRFLNRSWRMILEEQEDAMRLNARVVKDAVPNEEQNRILHKTIQAVTQDMENLGFNTAISRLMEFVNYFTSQDSRPLACMEAFILMLSPMAPHIAEELWQAIGHSESIAYAQWPVFDPRLAQESTIEIPIQINGKIRARISVPADFEGESIKQAALADERIIKYLEGTSIKKVIVAGKKLVNIVAG
jgi:leucyl-tRNA synthetase